MKDYFSDKACVFIRDSYLIVERLKEWKQETTKQKTKRSIMSLEAASQFCYRCVDLRVREKEKAESVIRKSGHILIIF